MEQIKAYRKTGVDTVSPLKQTVMLYDAAITNLQQAKLNIEEKNIQDVFNKIEKAYLIVSGLRDSLDMQIGGEVAETLKNWYSALSLRIITINSNHDTALCDLCIENLKEMKISWESVDTEITNKEFEDSKGKNSGIDNVQVSGESESSDETDYKSSTSIKPYSIADLQELSLSI